MSVPRAWFLLVTCLSMTGSVRAGDIPPPNLQVQADYAFVGDPLRGLGPGEPGALFERDADFVKGMASTTKSWAMYLTCKAVDEGVIALDDEVTLSGNALIPRCHGHSRMSGPDVPAPGDRYLLEDLLIANMVDSASDGTLGSAEHLVSVLQPGLTAAEREDFFVGMMNDAAADIGLVSTQFFNPYGGTHEHVGSCDFDNPEDDVVSGDDVDHVSSCREMAAWFDHAMNDSATFRALNAYRGSRIVTSVGATKTHGLNNYAFGYPGLVGRKPGGNSECSSCLVAGARRLGRDMVLGYMESSAGSLDDWDLFDYAYAVTFQPQQRAAAPPWKPASDWAVVDVGPTRAVAAIITPDRQLELAAWAVDVTQPSVARITSSRSWPCGERDGSPRRGPLLDVDGPPRGGDGQLPVRTVTPIRGASPNPRLGDLLAPRVDPTPWFPGDYDSSERLESVDLVHLGDGRLVAALETTLGISLISYGLPGCGVPFVRDVLAAGDGHDPVLEPIDGGLVVLGFVDDGGQLVLRTFGLDPGSGQFQPGALGGALDQRTVGVVSEFDLATRQRELLTANLVASTVVGGNLSVRNWQVLPDGSFIDLATRSHGEASHVSVTHVDGFHLLEDVFVTAYRRPSMNLLGLRVYRFELDGTFTNLGVAADEATLTVQADGAVTIESYEERGVVVSCKNLAVAPETTLAVFSVDADLNNPGDLDISHVVDETFLYGQGASELARLSTGRAEGDFLLLQHEFDEFPSQQELQLQLLRSGPRK
ncbi:MAG: hypothetical protein AAF533_22300 [Acidobacteriota bacterium]